MTKNTGIPYEKMIQHIYQQILTCEGLDTINVQHNIILKGKTTSHQMMSIGNSTFGDCVSHCDTGKTLGQ